MKIENTTIDGYAGIRFYNENGAVMELPLNYYSAKITDKNGKEGKLGELNTICGTDAMEIPSRCSAKINFKKDKMFLKREATEYSFEKGIWLYIPESVVKAEYLGEYVVREDTNETDYKKVYKLIGNFEIEHHKYEILPADFPIPHGGLQGRDATGFYEKRLKHSAGEPYVMHSYYEYTKETEIYLAPGPYSKIEYTQKKQNEKLLADELNNILGSQCKISHYDTEKLLKVFNITRK